jgi:F0F1-type ATP synthase membrane subunit b/b'
MINEIFWLIIALLTIVTLTYKPCKRTFEKFIDTKINKTRKLYEEAKKTYEDANLYLKKVKQDMDINLKENKKILRQTKNQVAQLTLDSEKDCELEIERQLKLAEAKREMEEKVLKKELVHTILTKTVEEVIAKLNKNADIDRKYINKSLDKLAKGEIKNTLN